MALPDQVAETPAGKPFAPDVPELEIPVAPVVVCVIGVKGVLIHKVGVEDAAVAVLFAETVPVNATLTALAAEFDSVIFPDGEPVAPEVSLTYTFVAATVPPAAPITIEGV